MTQPALRSTAQLIDEFIQKLTDIEELDADVVAVIQGLHQAGHLDSKNLLKRLAAQREEWDDGQAA